MSRNQEFNVLTYEPLSTTPRYVVHMFDRDGTRREYLNTAMFMTDPSKADAGTFVGIDSVAYNENNRLHVNQVTSGATDYGYLHADGKSMSKFIQGPSGNNIGLYTLGHGKKLFISVDSDGDGIIDHHQVFDALNHGVTIFTLETERNLRELEELINGANILCQMGSMSPGASGNAQHSFGTNVRSSAVIIGCNENGVAEGTGMPSAAAAAEMTGWIDSKCAGVLASSNGSPGGLVSTDPPETYREWVNDVGKKVAATGSALMATSIAMAATPAAPAAPVLLGVGIAFVVGGGAAFVVSGVIGWFESPMPGEAVEFDWDEYCATRATMHGTNSMDALQKMMSRQDCENPAENVSGVLTTGPINASPGGPRPRPLPGRFQPYYPNGLEDRLYCQNKVANTNMQSIWRTMVEEECNNPVAQPGEGGTDCGGRTTFTPGGQLDIGAAGIIAPRFAEDVKQMLKKVVNPGFTGRYIPN